MVATSSFQKYDYTCPQVGLFKRMFHGTRLHMVAPTVAGLAIIPALPLVDEPIEHLIDEAFEKYWPEEGGSHAHGHAHGSAVPASGGGASSSKQKKE